MCDASRLPRFSCPPTSRSDRMTDTNDQLLGDLLSAVIRWLAAWNLATSAEPYNDSNAELLWNTTEELITAAEATLHMDDED